MKKRNSAYSSSLQKRMKAERAETRHLYAIFAGVALAVGVIALTGWGIYAGLCHSVFFQVESITVEGSKRLNADEIAALAGLENKSNLIAVSKKKIEASLKATGWIRKVDIDKKWPNSIALIIHERTPTAMIYLDGVLSYIDSNGNIFAPVLVGEDLDYPVLFVPSSDMLADTRVMKGPLEMLRYASHGDPDLPKQNISQLVMDEEGGLTMYLADNPFPVILGKDKMWTKYKRLTKVLAWLYKKKKFSTVASIDMEYFEGRVLVKFNG